MSTAFALTRKNVFLAITTAVALTLVFTPSFAHAKDGDLGANCKSGGTCNSTDLKCDTSKKSNSKPNGECVKKDDATKSGAKDTFGLGKVNSGLDGSLGNQDLRTTVGSIINVALSLLGVVAVVIILLGGFRWMTAGGSEEKVDEARRLIFQGIIGLAIILSAWAIATFVLSKLSDATSPNSQNVPSEFIAS